MVCGPVVPLMADPLILVHTKCSCRNSFPKLLYNVFTAMMISSTIFLHIPSTRFLVKSTRYKMASINKEIIQFYRMSCTSIQFTCRLPPLSSSRYKHIVSKLLAASCHEGAKKAKEQVEAMLSKSTPKTMTVTPYATTGCRQFM